jgi:hypothetical protein
VSLRGRAGATGIQRAVKVRYAGRANIVTACDKTNTARAP